VTFLLDTSAFSDLIREHPQTEARLAALSPTDRVITCTVVRGEILFGIARLPHGRRKRELEGKTSKLFAAIPCEPIPETADDWYATIKLSRQQKGLALDENDLWIAATARALGAMLVTRDSNFRKIDDLSVDDWSA
jgi:predicted nucleic acid-binding protein